MSSVLKGLLTKADRAARRRSQRPTTGHVLLVMLQSGAAASRVLAQAGVREGDLLGALRIVAPESDSALEVAVERATKIALVQHETPDDLHMLLSICRDVCSSGYRCLNVFEGRPQRVRLDCESALGIAPPVPAETVAQPLVQSEAAAGPVRTSPDPLREPDPGSARSWSMNKAPAKLKKRKTKDNRRVRSGRAGGKPSGRPSSKLSSKLSRRPSARRDPNAVPAAGSQMDSAAGADALESAAAMLPPRDNPYALDPRCFPLLSSLGRNLSELAHAEALDPVFGRENEIEQLLDILGRRRANNPILVGPPGVGKTVLVEALAQRLVAADEGTTGLSSRIVIEVSAGTLVSGASVRGALAERMKRIQEEVLDLDGRVVLFIDEIHAIVGGEGPDGLATELKSMLTRGTLPCIGATTEEEFALHFEKDPALLRRFSPIRVNEPSPELAKRILRQLISKYEKHHGVAYSEHAIDAAVDWSVRYLTERQLPDKAIALLDQAGAAVARRKQSAVRPTAVAEVVAMKTSVPKERLLGDDHSRFLSLDTALEKHVVGHKAPIHRICETLRLGAAGLRGGRPLGTFLLLGPTGVGKTEMAKAVAEEVFPDGGLVRFDMSEFSSAHSVARLFGAPPGYIGHDRGGQLTESIRRRPYQLILLDEIEKAHPDVLLALLPLLDEGRLTDGRGRTVDFTHTIIFMTSNLGAQGSKSARIGFGGAPDTASANPDAAAAIAGARASLPPELWNRIDEPLFFQSLSREEVSEIATRMIASVGSKLLKSRGVTLVSDSSVVESLILGGGFDKSLGARPMRRTVGRLLEAPLAKLLLSSGLSFGDEIRVTGSGACLTLEVESSPKASPKTRTPSLSGMESSLDAPAPA